MAPSASSCAWNSVFSILPWEIGTPSSTQGRIPSCLSIPSSFESSSGVRWFAMTLLPEQQKSPSARRASRARSKLPRVVGGTQEVRPPRSSISLNVLPAADGGKTAAISRGTHLDGILDLEVLPLQGEAGGEMLGKRLDAEPLGRMVPRRDEGDPELARGVEARLLRLARQEQVVARARRGD